MDGLLAASVLQRNGNPPPRTLPPPSQPSPTADPPPSPHLLLLPGKYFGSFERDSTCSREREKKSDNLFFSLSPNFLEAGGKIVAARRKCEMI